MNLFGLGIFVATYNSFLSFLMLSEHVYAKIFLSSAITYAKSFVRASYCMQSMLLMTRPELGKK